MRLEYHERYAVLLATYRTDALETAANTLRTHAARDNDLAVTLRTLSRLSPWLPPLVKCHFTSIAQLALTGQTEQLETWENEHYSCIRQAMQHLLWKDKEHAL